MRSEQRCTKYPPPLSIVNESKRLENSVNRSNARWIEMHCFSEDSLDRQSMLVYWVVGTEKILSDSLNFRRAIRFCFVLERLKDEHRRGERLTCIWGGSLGNLLVTNPWFWQKELPIGDVFLFGRDWRYWTLSPTRTFQRLILETGFMALKRHNDRPTFPKKRYRLRSR